MYKLYIGDYLNEGTPATWTIVCQTPKRYLARHINEIIPRMKPGWELYIVHNNQTKAYFRENLGRYFDEKEDRKSFNG